MPLHVDIRLNERMLRRIHIARMTSNGMQPDSINEYAVVVDTIPIPVATGLSTCNESRIPEQWEWDASEIRFPHRYGDDAIDCVTKALELVRSIENTPR